MKSYFTYKDLLIPLTIIVKDNTISEIVFEHEYFDQSIIQQETELHRQCYQQLREYFNSKRQSFDLPLSLSGTNFQQKVYYELLNIPYGQVISYEELAKRIGQPTAYRAVGNANGKNKIPIIIPCHRVIAKNGLLGGYSGGLNIKEKLLEIEGVKPWKK